jgi:hypothetical protein
MFDVTGRTALTAGATLSIAAAVRLVSQGGPPDQADAAWERRGCPLFDGPAARLVEPRANPVRMLVKPIEVW